jgi:hypothetical protein
MGFPRPSDLPPAHPEVSAPSQYLRLPSDHHVVPITPGQLLIINYDLANAYKRE